MMEPKRAAFQSVLVTLGIFVLSVAPLNAQSSLCSNIENSKLMVPHIVVGSTEGPEFVTYVTTVTISNAASQEVNLRFRVRGGTPGLGFPDEEVTVLPAGSTRVIEYKVGQGQPLDLGWLRVVTDQPVSVVAHIQGRDADGRLVSNVSVPGVMEASRFVIPVFHNDPLADNTGIAMVVESGGVISAELRDLQGNLVATRELLADVVCAALEIFPTPETCNLPADFSVREAILLQELFPDLPADFRRGLLSIEHLTHLGDNGSVIGPQNPFAMAVMGLYTNGLDLRAAPGRMVDIPTRFRAALPLEVDVDELAHQYGFSIVQAKSFSVENTTLLDLTATAEVARALSRDPRVLGICHSAAAFDRQ